MKIVLILGGVQMFSSLPPRFFYCLAEAAARWSVIPFDVVGWASEGLLALSIALPPVKTGPSETISRSGGRRSTARSAAFPERRRVQSGRVDPAGQRE